MIHGPKLITTVMVSVVLSASGCSQEPGVQAGIAPAAVSAGGVVAEARLQEGGKFAFDVNDHPPAEVEALLVRAEMLAGGFPEGSEYPPVELILHGREIIYFTKDNYEKYRNLVDLAAKLDAYGVIDVKICRTLMRDHGLESGDFPAFVEEVPYGPDEVQRLRREGYVIL